MKTMTTDYDIRASLREMLPEENSSDSMIVEELGLCQGDARIDIAVVNGHLNGFEIKSDVDSLRRLGNQIGIYSSVLDTVTLVTTTRHLEDALNLIPDWWGVRLVREHDSVLEHSIFREGELNPSIDKFALAQLLWKDEVLTSLEALARCAIKKSAPRRELWKTLAFVTSFDELNQIVRIALKKRGHWRPDPLPTSGDLRSQLFSKSLHYLDRHSAEHIDL